MTVTRPDPSALALRDCKAQWHRSLSSTTARSYGYCLHRLADWLRAHKTNLVDATRPDLTAYIKEREEAVSRATAHVDWKAMRSFYAWAKEDDVRDDNPAEKITAPRLPKRQHHHVATEPRSRPSTR